MLICTVALFWQRTHLTWPTLSRDDELRYHNSLKCARGSGREFVSHLQARARDNAQSTLKT